jgi:hypothetical protein
LGVGWLRSVHRKPLPARELLIMLTARKPSQATPC